MSLLMPSEVINYYVIIIVVVIIVIVIVITACQLNAEGLQKNLAKELAKLKQLELEKMRKRGILPEATEVEQEGDGENYDDDYYYYYYFCCYVYIYIHIYIYIKHCYIY